MAASSLWQQLWQQLLDRIFPSDDISLNKIEGWVTDLDNQSKKSLSLTGVAFEKTTDNQLGFLGQQDTFTVFMPWSSWPDFGKRDFPAPLQQAVFDAIDQANESEQADTVTLAIPFMDLASLVPGTQFFTEQAGGRSVAQAIADWIDSHDHEKTQSCIRFLVGDNGSRGRDLSFHGEPFTDMFWPKVHSDREALVKHPKARIFVGYYNPNFHPTSTDSAAVKFIPDLVKRVTDLGPKFGVQLAVPESALEELAESLVSSGIPTVSWNHGKILAINGDVLMTGGANYQQEYQNYFPWDAPEEQRKDHEIYDHQAKISGGAAISAHKWADYFWSYLQSPADTDSNSTWWGAYLANNPNAIWYAGHDQHTQVPDRLPEIKGLDGKLPKDVVTCPIRANMRSAHQGSSNVFTVSKIGNWYGPQGQVNYPVQIIDAARDILLNALYQRSLNDIQDGPEGSGGYMWGINKLMSDDWLMTIPLMGNLSLSDMKINPTAWASRYTKIWAIAYAQESVVICQQLLVGTLQADEDEYQKLVEKVNTGLGLTTEQRWDGHIWPFDLIIAIAQAIGAIWNKYSSIDVVEEANDKLHGVFIVLTTSQEGHRKGEGWHDKTPIARIKHRIAKIVKGLPQGDGGGIPYKHVNSAIDRFLHIKRVMNDDGKAFSHSKIVCVDAKVMYIGSDNAYPSYNEEHGIWVDDKGSIGSWLKTFFEPYWAKCTTPDPAKEGTFSN